MAKTKGKAYRARAELDYHTAEGRKIVPPGEVVDDLPAKSVGWLLEQGWIEPADSKDGEK